MMCRKREWISSFHSRLPKIPQNGNDFSVFIPVFTNGNKIAIFYSHFRPKMAFGNEKPDSIPDLNIKFYHEWLELE